MRIALALTGQFRMRPKCLELISNNLLSKIKCDVFICTWNKQAGCYNPISTDRTSIIHGSEAKETSIVLDIPKYYFGSYAELFPVESRKLQGFKKLFVNTYEKLLVKEEEITDVSFIYKFLKPKLIGLFDELDFETKSESMLAPVNQKKQFYLLNMVSKQIELYENQNNFKYDYIIRMRLDQGIETFPDLEYLTNISKNELHGFYGVSFGIDDCFFFGDRDTILKIFNLWEFSLKNKSYLSPFINYKLAYSHLLLFLWIIYNNINFIPCNNIVNLYQGIKEDVFDYFKPYIKADVNNMPIKLKESIQPLINSL